jgi:hypothetical protein
VFQNHLNSIRITRKLLFGLAATMTNEELNTIPEGFRNNVAWHLGHVIAVQQGLTYQMSGLQATVSIDVMKRFPMGSFPDGHLNDAYIKELKSLSIKTLDEMEEDYNTGRFANYKPYMSSFGYQMNTIEEAIAFLPIHEGIHLGYVMSMRRTLA